MSGPECQELCGAAATALSTLQAENENLRTELEDLKAIWDMYGGDDGVTAVYTERDGLMERLQNYKEFEKNIKEHAMELLELVRELNSLNDEKLAERVLLDSDVQWCLGELQDILEFEETEETT